MTDKPKLHLIQGTLVPDTPAEKVRKRVRAMPKPPTMVQCHRSGGRKVIETKIGVLMKSGSQRVGLRR